ncbi:MAG: S-layer homology domain-containing protein, partial [Clostridia bacterium]|nr:S-layer homology domain-containing protein [Clostridia bacterium]
EEKMTDDANLIDLFVEIALEMGMEMEDLGDIEAIKEEAKEQLGIDLTIRNVLNVTGIDESYMYEGSYGIEVLKTPINVPKNVSLGKTMYDKDTKENFTNLPLNESTSRTLVTTLVRYYDGKEKDKIVSYEFVGYNQDAVYENKNYNIWYEKETGIETKLKNIIAPIDVYGELRIDCDAVAVTHDETTYLITVTDRGTELIQETDYKVTYVENKEKGEITAIIEGINRYVGTREYTYEGSFSDNTNPKVLKISATPGVYKRNQKMPITVEFDKDVILENGAQMSIMIKGKNGEEYSNLEKTKITYNVKKDVPSKEKIFEYKVKSGDLALNGLEVTELEIIGAGFKDEYNNLMEPSVNLKEVVCNFDTTYINAANVLNINMTSSKNNETMITFSFENEVVNDSFTKEDILVTINGKEVSASSLGELTTEDNKNYTLKFKMPQNANNQLLMVSVLSEVSEDVNGNANLSYTNKLEVKGTGNVNGVGYKNSTFTIEFPGGTVTNKVNVSSKIDKEIKSYMTGYKDGTFRPNDTLTRAEVAAILARISKDYSDKKSYIEKVNYQDVRKDSWSSNYIGYMQEKGMMTGTSNYFRPNAKITRAEFTRAIVRMLDLESNDLGSNKFLDATNKWYEKDAILLS